MKIATLGFILILITFFSCGPDKTNDDRMKGNSLDTLDIIPHRFGHIYLNITKTDSIPFLIGINVTDSLSYIGLMVPPEILPAIIHEAETGPVSVIILFDPKEPSVPPMVIGLNKKEQINVKKT